MQTTVETTKGKKVKNEIAHRQASLPSTEVTYQEQEVLNSDIIIPQLYLMQGLSTFVAERKAQIGDIVRSTTAEKVGDDKAPLSFIPLKLTNNWTIFEKVPGQKNQEAKWEFRGMAARTAANEADPYEFEKDGTTWKRVKTINVFALLSKDIASFIEEMKKDVIDIEKTLMPVVISFRSTSFNAGRTVATFFTKIRSNLQYNKSLAPYKYELPLSCSLDENDKGKYFVYEVGASKPLDASLLAEASKWYQILNTANDIKIDTSIEEGGSAKASPIDVSTVSAF